jgi:HD-GYP domain-containing protein (c-di-GMP phosphodiesterase class II)
VLALSTLPALRRPRAVKPLLVLDAVLFLGILGLGVLGLAFPSIVPSVPEVGSPAAYVLLAVGLVFFGALAFRAARTYLLTRRRADLVVVVGLTWLGVALFPVLLVEYGHLAFWVGHVLELAGVAMVGGPVALDLYRGSQSRPLVGDLRAQELMTAEEAFLGPRVRSLMLRLAEKDVYTEGHTRRVAERAVMLGESFGLSAGRLRNLAMGGLLHDMGKLSVPDDILQKPSPLDDDEFSVIKRHPEWGNQLIAELGGFPDGVRRLVLDHHERLDGRGYPRALRLDELDLETRILTVCDVYDALISERVYREAWTTERALALLPGRGRRRVRPRVRSDAREAPRPHAREPGRRPDRRLAAPQLGSGMVGSASASAATASGSPRWYRRRARNPANATRRLAARHST